MADLDGAFTGIRECFQCASHGGFFDSFREEVVRGGLGGLDAAGERAGKGGEAPVRGERKGWGVGGVGGKYRV